MAQTAATLAVKIVADISDLEKNFSKADRAALKFADHLTEFGKKLTLGITLPVAAAAAGLAKMAAENENTAGRMTRVFGDMSKSIENSITEMMKSVPEARTDLEKMAISIDNMLQGMDVAPQRAAAMSASMLKLAGDVSAFAHVPMEEALDALERGLAGKTKGLLSFGIAINEADIKQKAFQMGILSSGHELTETGTAMASYALIMEKTSRVQGEAARTANEQGKQFAFLKRDLVELADQVSGIVLPTMSGLARAARDMVADLSRVPEGVTKVIFGLAGIAAVAMPVIYSLGNITKAFITLRAMVATFSAGGGIAGIFAGLSNPIGQIVLAVAGLTAALTSLWLIWKKIHPDAGSGLGEDPSLAASLGGGIAGAGGKSGPTDRDPKDPLAQMKESAGIVASAFDAAVTHGGSMVRIFERINELHSEATRMLNAQGGAFTKEGEGAREIADQMQRLKDIMAVAMAPGTAAAQGILNQIGARPFDLGTAGAQSAVDAAEAYRRDLATRAAASQYQVPFNAQTEAGIKSRSMVASSANDLALREELLQLPDGFDAARQAAVELGEEQRNLAETTALQYERIKGGLESFGLHLGNLGTGMQRVVTGMFDAVTSFAQGLAQRLGASGANAGLIGGIGSLLGGAFAGSKFGAAFGPLGAAAGGIAGALIGGLFDHHKQSVDNSATALDGLATAAQKVTEALTNVPQGFKVAYDRYLAATAVPIPGDGSGGSGGGGGGGGGTPKGGNGGGSAKSISVQTLNLHVQNVANVDDLFRALGTAAEVINARGGTSALTLAVG